MKRNRKRFRSELDAPFTKAEKRNLVKQYKALVKGDIPLIGVNDRYARILVLT